MKAEGIAFQHSSDDEHGHSPEDHLPRRQHGGGEAHGAGLEPDIGKSRAGRANDNSEAAPKRHDAVEIEQMRTDHGHAGQSQKRSDEFARLQGFVRQHPVSEHHSGNGDGCLKHGGEAGGDVQFPPEKESVIERKH